MISLFDMLWVETRKAVRSRMPLWTALGSLLMPLGIGFLLVVSKNPEMSRRLGVISAKADLLAFAAADWQTYLGMFGQLIATAGFILFTLVISWVFGREFADGTVKDLLAVPVARSTILLAKFIVAAVWSLGLALILLAVGLILGALFGLPGGANRVLVQGSAAIMITACLVIMVVLPFAFFASVGRGYLLPIGAAVVALMAANLAAVVGRGEVFPWSIPAVYAMGSPLTLPGLGMVLLLALAGVAVTQLWWQRADQNR